jgi:hypothetical protein
MEANQEKSEKRNRSEKQFSKTKLNQRVRSMGNELKVISVFFVQK